MSSDRNDFFNRIEAMCDSISFCIDIPNTRPARILFISGIGELALGDLTYIPNDLEEYQSLVYFAARICRPKNVFGGIKWNLIENQ